MNIDKSKLRLLIYFQALLEDRNVTSAAKKTGITQAAMSNVLTRLREIFQDELLVRQGRQMVPTVRALELIEPVNEVLRNAEQLFSPHKFDPMTETQEFHIGCPDYMEYAILSPLALKLREVAPKISLNIHTISQINADWLVNRQHMDLFIGVLTTKPEYYESEYLYSDYPICLMWEQNPLAKGPLTQKKFLEAPHLVIKFRHEQLSQLFDERLSHWGYPPRQRSFSTPYSLNAVHMLPGSHYLLIVGRQFYEALKSLNLPIVAMDVPIPEFKKRPLRFELVWHKKNNLDLAHQWLRKQIRTFIAEATEDNE